MRAGELVGWVARGKEGRAEGEGKQARWQAGVLRVPMIEQRWCVETARETD